MATKEELELTRYKELAASENKRANEAAQNNVKSMLIGFVCGALSTGSLWILWR
jgi:hypothetical protein